VWTVGRQWQLQFLIYTVLQRVFMPLTGWRQAQILAQKALSRKKKKIKTGSGNHRPQVGGAESPFAYLFWAGCIFNEMSNWPKFI